MSELDPVPEEGIVKWYSVAKGYGFIRREAESDGDGSKEADIFVHHSEVPPEGLAEGERVRFEVIESPKGLKARKVILAA